MRGRTQELVSNANRYRQSFDKTDLPKEPRTGVAVVSCIDARLNIYDLLGSSRAALTSSATPVA